MRSFFLIVASKLSGCRQVDKCGRRKIPVWIEPNQVWVQLWCLFTRRVINVGRARSKLIASFRKNWEVGFDGMGSKISILLKLKALKNSFKKHCAQQCQRKPAMGNQGHELKRKKTNSSKVFKIQHSQGRVRQLSVSSRPARATWRDPISNQQNKQKTPNVSDTFTMVALASKG